MCIRLVYYFISCGHVEQDGWTCRNQHYNLFCDSPFLEQQAVNDESCTKCRIKTLKRNAVLDQINRSNIIDLDSEDEAEQVESKELDEGERLCARLLVEIARMTEDEENAKANVGRSLIDMAVKEGEQKKISDAFKVTNSKRAGGK